VKSVFKKPHDDAFGDAQPHTIDEAQKVKVDLHDMRHCLAEGYPFVFGMEIFKAFEDTGSDGVVATPSDGAKDSCGGHAMLCVGYSDQDQVFVVRNSWGPKWGDGGYCYVPYDYLANPNYAHDAWTLRRAHDLDFNQGIGGAERPHGDKKSFLADNDDGSSSDSSDSDSSDSDSSDADSSTDDSSSSADSADSSTDDTSASDSSSSDSSDSSASDSDGADSSDSGGSESLIEKLEDEIKELEGELASLKGEDDDN
jgi:hypothetical protein